MQRICFAAAALLLLAACGTGGPDQEESGNTEPDTITVSPRDTIGVLMGDSNSVFGTIADAVTLDGGTIAILDEAKGCARLFTPQGQFIRQISRSGSGPGELLRPGGMVRLSDNSIGILDHASGLHRFSPEGNYLDLTTDFLGRNVPQWAWGVNDMGYVGAITAMEPVEENMVASFIIGRWDQGSEPSVEYFRNSFNFDPLRMDEFLRNSFFSASFAASADGMVFVAPTSSETYEIMVYEPDGSLYSTISRKMPRIQKSPEELAEETAMITAILKERGIPEDHIMYEPDPYRWLIQPQGLGVDGEERVWVRNGASEQVVMDVYDPSGEHLAVVRIQGVTEPGTMDFLNVKVQPHAILIYSLQDPEYPRLYVLDMPDLG